MMAGALLTSRPTSDESAAESDNVVEATGIHKSFGDLHVLKGVDLTVSRGEVVAVIGVSGSGKTTLLRCLNHLEPIDAGIIRVNGGLMGYIGEAGTLREAPRREIARHRRQIGFVFQRFNLFPHLTAIENVMTGPRVVLGVPKREAERQAHELLALVGLPEKCDAYPARLSGGQQQRVAIARALAMKPALLLFDEPTSALDPEMTREVVDVIRRLARGGMTMIVVSHEMSFIRTGCDRVLVMDTGVIVEEGRTADIFTAASHARTRALLDSAGFSNSVQ